MQMRSADARREVQLHDAEWLSTALGFAGVFAYVDRETFSSTAFERTRNDQSNKVACRCTQIKCIDAPAAL